MINSNSISEMERLMNIIDGDIASSTKSSNINSDKKTESMKRILEAMYSVSENAIETGSEIREVKEAFETEETTNGIRIGPWYIDCIPESRVRKSYHIRNENSQEYLISDLSLYEAAYAVVKQLRANENVNSKTVQTILRLESDYSKYLNDAVFQKHVLMSKNLTETRRLIVEDKYGSAKYKAANAKERIKEYL